MAPYLRQNRLLSEAQPPYVMYLLYCLFSPCPCHSQSCVPYTPPDAAPRSEGASSHFPRDVDHSFRQNAISYIPRDVDPSFLEDNIACSPWDSIPRFLQATLPHSLCDKTLTSSGTLSPTFRSSLRSLRHRSLLSTR